MRLPVDVRASAVRRGIVLASLVLLAAASVGRRSAAVAGVGSGAPETTSFVVFAPSTWPRPDLELGFGATAVVEDFEDVVLEPGLRVQVSGGAADFGPTSILPNVFDPPADDPNGPVFHDAPWAGPHVLLNRSSKPVSYVDGEWADLTLHVADGACRVGFAMSQAEGADVMVHVQTRDGATSFRLSDSPGWAVGGPNSGRNGYVRIDAAVDDAILSVRIAGVTGDGYAVDHVVVEPAVPPLAAHWRFDEQGGTTAHDSVGPWDGTMVGGAAFVPGGVSGNALALDVATGGYVDAGSAFPDFVGSSFSISAWLRTSSPLQQMVVTKHTTGVIHGYMLAVNTIGPNYGLQERASFYASNAPGGEVNSTTKVDDGQWHHVVGVYRTGGDVRIYVDGTPAEDVKSAANAVSDSAPLLIGGVADLGTPGAHFTGLIDDVQIYAGALSEPQIRRLFDAPGNDLLGTVVPPVTAYFLPKSVAVKLRGAGKDSLKAVGVYDDGGVEVDYGQPVTVTIGGFERTVALTANGSGTVLSGTADGLKLQLRPNRFGSSRGLFVLQATKATLDGLIDVEGTADLRLSAEHLDDAVGRIRLTRGRFQVGKARGALEAPAFFPTRVVAKLSDTKPDALKLKAGFHAGETVPTALGSVLLGLGPDLQLALAGSEFEGRAGVFTARRSGDGGTLTVRIDFVRELLTVSAKGLELGPLDGETTEVVFDAGEGTGTQRATIRLGGDGDRRGY